MLSRPGNEPLNDKYNLPELEESSKSRKRFVKQLIEGRFIKGSATCSITESHKPPFEKSTSILHLLRGLTTSNMPAWNREQKTAL